MKPSNALVQLGPYHQECNGCAYGSCVVKDDKGKIIYAGQKKTKVAFTCAFDWNITAEDKLCEEISCRSHGLYMLMKGIEVTVDPITSMIRFKYLLNLK